MICCIEGARDEGQQAQLRSEIRLKVLENERGSSNGESERSECDSSIPDWSAAKYLVIDVPFR